MSKVVIYHAPNKDSYPASAAVIATGWKPGQLGALNSDGSSIKLAITDETLFVLADDDLELSAPPTGSLCTCLYGSGTKLVIEHSAAEIADTTRAYSVVGNPESAVMNQDLYVDAVGKFTTASTGSVKAKVWQIPSAANSYGLGVITRF
jgi:hypothetical protein